MKDIQEHKGIDKDYRSERKTVLNVNYFIYFRWKDPKKYHRY